MDKETITTMNRGLMIIIGKEPMANLEPSHDQVHIGTYDSDLYSKEERQELETLGWFEEYDAWSHFS